MTEFDNNMKRGATLMQQALKKYAEGDFESGDKDRKLANDYFDKASVEINSQEGKMSQLYGESRNFGVIYNIFEQNIDNICQDKKKKHVIKEVYKAIKDNPVLNEQFKVYDMFEKATGIENAKEFVTESVSLIGHYDKESVKKENEKLIRLIKENKLDEYVEIPEEIENLYEAVEYVFLNDKTLENVNNFIKAQNTIIEHLEKNKDKLNEQKQLSFKDFEKNILSEEKKINEDINEDEKQLLESFMDKDTNKKMIFENYKSETLKKIKEALDSSSAEEREEWKKVYESIERKTFSEKMSENIINCAEMMEICSTFQE